ncbi:MAG: hypothetical protein ABIH41_00450 [Nanoarchaeota archaeon]
MKKNILIALLMLSIMILPAYAVDRGTGSLVGDNVALDATLLRYEPNPPEPGDVVAVYVILTNSGSQSAKDVLIEMQDNYPFSVDNSVDAIKTLPSLPGAESYVGRWKVRVDKNADEGTSYVKIRFKQGTTNSYTERLLAIDIVTNDAALIIDDAEQEPSPVHPGGTAQIVLHLKNLADSRLRDIALRLQTTRTVGSTTTSVPFAPIKGSLERRFDTIDPGADATLIYDIVVDPDAASGVYRIPVTLTYSDLQGNDFSTSTEIALLVNSPGMISAYTDTVDLYSDNRQGDITMRFVNRGLAQVKLLSVDLPESDDYQLISNSRSEYIGNIDSDDYETLKITIKANSDEFDIPVSIHYLDQLNTEYSQETSIHVRLISSAEAGIKNGNSTGMVVLVIIVLVAGFFVVRRLRKRKRG